MRENSGTLEEAVSIRAADKVFNPDSDNEVQALLGIDLDVKEGDFIQVISPTGRQCSDFVAFDTAKLDKRIEKGLEGVCPLY